MSDPRFLFVVAEGPGATVIDSQVVDNVVLLGREGVHFDLLFLANPGPAWRQRVYYAKRRAEIAERTGGSVRIAAVPHPRTSAGSAFGAAVLAREVLRSPGRRLVIHGRTDASAYFASLVARWHPGLRYVFDVRGDGPAEFRLEMERRKLPAAQSDPILRRMLQMRGDAIARAEHVLCVSTVLRDRLIAMHGLDPRRSTVVPCVADSDKFDIDDAERRAMRRTLGIEDRFVVVYPGRIGAWHYSDETFAVVRGLMDADPRVFFLVLTPDLAAATALAAKALPEGRYAIRSATHAEVPGYLRAADLGVLLRAPDPLNEVACPTKFAEYVLSGLPVLISPGIGDCSPFVGENKAGAVLATPDPRAAVAALVGIRSEPDDARRARIGALGALLSRQRYVCEMAALYRRIAAIS